MTDTGDHLSPVELIEAMYAARRRGDLDAVLASLSDTVVFTCNVDPYDPASCITLVGKAASRAYLQKVDAGWEPLSSTHGPIAVSETPPAHPGDAPVTDLRLHFNFAVRHSLSGHTYQGSKTHELKVRAGKIISLRETLDREFIKAFVAMVRWSKDTAAPVATQAPPAARASS